MCEKLCHFLFKCFLTSQKSTIYEKKKRFRTGHYKITKQQFSLIQTKYAQFSFETKIIVCHKKNADKG